MNATCLKCKTESTIRPIIDLDLIKLVRHYVCGACLFPTSLDAMLDAIPEFETMPETSTDAATDDPPMASDVPPIVTDGKRITRKVDSRDCSKVRLPELFKRGIVRTDDRVECGSLTAYVVNAVHVKRTDGSLVTWNHFGQMATGHKAVNIYKHMRVNGVLLESLRWQA